MKSSVAFNPPSFIQRCGGSRVGEVLRAAAQTSHSLFCVCATAPGLALPPSLPHASRTPRVSRMAAVSDDLIWLLVKNNNRFLVKRNGNNNNSVQFSSEANNLYNLNTFKYSGLANKKTVAIAPAEGLAVTLTTTKTKKRNQPAKLRHSSNLKKDFRKMAKTVVNQVATNGYRADLKSAALARLAAVHKSLRVAKAGVTKKKSKARTPARQ